MGCNDFKRVIVDGVTYDYMINPDGVVYSLISNHILNQQVTKKGYREVTLYSNGHRRIFKVHRLVAIMFIPNPLKLPEVNHIDTDKSNNKITNLEWVSSKENMQHASHHGLLIKPKGERHHNSNYLDDVADAVCELISQGCSNHEISEKMNISNIDFIKHIRSRSTYRWISEKYIFPKYTNEQQRSRDLVEIIKVLIDRGYSNSDIRRILNLENTRRIHDIIKGLRSNKIYKDVKCDKYYIIIE